MNAADYEQLALGWLDEAFQEHEVVIACGGTGLYLQALTEGLDDMPAVSQVHAREVNDCFAMGGLGWLQEAIMREDSEFWAQAEQSNPARLIRALIFKRSTGESILNHQKQEKKHRPFKIIKTAIGLPRPILYERIEKRVDEMVNQGLVDEVAFLLPFKHLPVMKTVGYSELIAYMDGEISLEEAIKKIKQHSRNYAKRQITWFKKDSEYTWLEGSTDEVFEQIMSRL